MVTAGLIALLLVETAPPPDASNQPPPPPPAPAVEAQPAPAVEPQPPPVIEPQPPPVIEPRMPRRPRMYGDRGSVEIGAGLGYSSAIGFVAAGAFRYFVIDGVAPGIEATYVSGGTNGITYGLLLGALRLVPVRSGSFALVLTGRGGRVLIGDHADGWGVGGGAGVLILFAPTAGLELGYEALRLYPSSFCADLSSCVIHGPVVGIRVGF